MATHNSTTTTERSNLGEPSGCTAIGCLERHGSVPLMEEGPYGKRPQSQVTIDMLSDDVLLEIFYCYQDSPKSSVNFRWNWWKTLIHVCRRWRYIIFGSPRHLNLQLLCSERTPSKRLLDIWPPFPIVIESVIDTNVDDPEGGVENLIAALERRDRISSISIGDWTYKSAVRKSTAAMYESFPILISCELSANKFALTPVLPETFLGGSAPRLVYFLLRAIPFPTLPNFVLSSTQIQHLHLQDIPNPGYISPDMMATCVAALPNLRYFSIGFQSPLSRPVEVTPPPLTRAVLPTLISLFFGGVSEYFEDFIARIDTPKLVVLRVIFFMDLIFDIPQLHNFMIRAEPANQASMEFTSQMIELTLESLGSDSRFELGIRCERLDWQLSSMTQIFNEQLPLLSHIEHLEVCEPHESRFRREWEDDPDMDSSRWIELFHLFIAAQSLYVSERLVHPITAAMEELPGEMAMEVLPALRSLSLEGLQPSGSVQDSMKSFVTTRQLTGNPVMIQPWDRRPSL